MQVQQIMTPGPRACGLDTNLCEAVQMMWEGDFGVLPVVDDEGHVLGIVTDRDLAVALGTRNLAPSSVRAGDVMTGPVKTVQGDDEVETVLRVMRDYRVRRVPVVDGENRLCGMLTLNDLILARDVNPADLMETLSAICAHYRPAENALIAAA